MGRKNHIRSRPQRRKHQSPHQVGSILGAVRPTIIACVTGKRGFTLEVAQAKLDSYSGQDGLGSRNNRPVRIYACDKCSGYHLTSKPLRGGGGT